MSTEQIAQVVVTCDDAEALRAMVNDMVSARLAACGQVEGPVVSTYWWDGAVESATEHRATLKTTMARTPELVRRLVERHPYEVPEVLVVPVSGGNLDYLQWVSATVGPQAG